MVPSRRFVLLVAAGLVPLVLGLVWGPGVALGVAWDLGLAVLLGVDLARAPRPARLSVTREVEDVLSIGVPATVTLRLRWRGRRRAAVRLVDAPPEGFTVTAASGATDPATGAAGAPDRIGGARGTLVLPAGAEGRQRYRVVPHHRGEHRFGDLYLRLEGPLGLALRLHRVPLAQAVRVYPDVTALMRDERALLATRTLGARRLPRRVQGGRAFDRLREYVAGDDVRHLDWKATARRGQPVTREYRPEQNQDVILMLDCGRHMRPKVDTQTKLDHAVSAALTLAGVALSRGDRVGLVAFGHAVDAWLPPRKGRDQLLRIVDALYPVEASLAEADYHAAYDALGRRALRRALIVTFTDLLDEDASRVLLARTERLRPRHLPLVVTVADGGLAKVAHGRPADRDGALRHVAAARVLRDREATVRRLALGGALVVDVPAEDLTAATVSRYLEVKASGRL